MPLKLPPRAVMLARCAPDETAPFDEPKKNGKKLEDPPLLFSSLEYSAAFASSASSRACLAESAFQPAQPSEASARTASQPKSLGNLPLFAAEPSAPDPCCPGSSGQGVSIVPPMC